jgi:hypothetical protein
MTDKTEAMDNLIAQDADLIEICPDNFQNLLLNESFERLAKVAEERAAFNAGIEAAANALEADAKKCDCFARNEGECGCGAWCEWKSITSQRAIEIVRALATPPQ